MRILAVTVGRDEANRYLAPVLDWTRRFVDRHLYYDDGSTDASVEIASQCGCVAIEREADDPAFMDNEAACRQSAWECLDSLFAPTADDWVLSVDADEFVMASGDVRAALERAATMAAHANAGAVNLAINEVFGWDDEDRPLIRVDGFWGQISGVRLARWTGNTDFKPIDMGGGSVPHGMGENAFDVASVGILHFGYADAADRAAKYERYLARPGRHNPMHVGSILQKGELRAWTAELPWRS